MKHVTILAFIEKITLDKTSLEDVYANRLMMYYVDNSDTKEQTNNIGFVYNNGILEDAESISISKTTKGFELTEIDFITYELEYLENHFEVEKLKISEKKQFGMYVNFLKSKFVNSELPDNTNTDGDNKELHSHIFKGNSFDVWQSMFSEFGINESSRTDVKFMFEEMKKDYLIHNTVNQITFLDWIGETYNGLIIQKTSNHSRTKTRIQAYQRAKEFYKN